jgi:hypothetical protein
MKDPYSVLGLSADASAEELERRYNELKSKYGEERFLTGEAGNAAARNLSELETAWREIQALREREQAKREYGGNYGLIDSLIKEGKYDEAQAGLDAISDRVGEWHFLQSVIYYKREWMNECKAQLQMAVNMEPWNDKYKTTLERLNLVMGNPHTDPRTIGVDPSAANPPVSDGQMCGNACTNCCLAYCITDCCCSMTQCC